MDSCIDNLAQLLDPDYEQGNRVLSLTEFAKSANPRFETYQHVKSLIRVLERVESGELKRVMVFMPPRHGKSELVSRIFPAWYLHKHPDHWTAISSYAAEIAYGFSRNARDNYSFNGGELKSDAYAVKQWETGKGGGLWATGVGGPATGRGFHVGIIDDPIKNAEEAASRIIRQKHWDWWLSTWTTRQEPGAAMIVVQTRWHEDDLSGRLLENEEEDPEGWHIVNFEAIKESEPLQVPASCELEPDERKPGEPLCKERYDLSDLQKIKRKSIRVWTSLFQQRPAPLEGAMWKRSWFENHAFVEAPKNLRFLAYDWDTAYTKNEQNSAFAYIYSGVDEEGTMWILDLDFFWMETPAAEQRMKFLKGPHCVEAKASGKSLVQNLKAKGIIATEVEVKGGLDKIARTSLVTFHAEAGKVRVAKHLLQKLLDDERQGILKFPNGSHDDVNDVLVQGINRVMKSGASVKGASFKMNF